MTEGSYGIGDIVTDKRTNEQYKITGISDCIIKL